MTTKEKYLENKVYTTSMGAESIEALLLRKGIDGVSVEDPMDARDIIESKDTLKWDYLDESIKSDATLKSPEVVVIFYTIDDSEGNALLSEIKTEIMKLKADEQYGAYGKDADFGRLYLESNPLKSDWENSWKETFVPFRASNQFVVRPPWEEYKGDGRVIVIDPGMVFGIGTHETTSMCIEALESLVNSESTVLDAGTGTGILAIASAMLGAKTIAAIEFDHDAVVSAASNIKENSVSKRVDLIEGDLLKLDELKAAGQFNYGENSFDIIVANLVSGLLKKILPVLTKLLKPEGHIILSGLLATELDDMFYEVGINGFKNIQPEVKGEWLSICADL